MNCDLENPLLPIICDRLERWDTHDRACVNIRWRQKERNAYSWGIPRNFPTGAVSVLLVRTRNIVERQAVQWVDGPKKTGGDGTGSDRGMKSAADGTIVERGTPQLNVQELGQEQQLTLHEHDTQEASSEHEGET